MQQALRKQVLGFNNGYPLGSPNYRELYKVGEVITAADLGGCEFTVVPRLLPRCVFQFYVVAGASGPVLVLEREGGRAFPAEMRAGWVARKQGLAVPEFLERMSGLGLLGVLMKWEIVLR